MALLLIVLQSRQQRARHGPGPFRVEIVRCAAIGTHERSNDGRAPRADLLIRLPAFQPLLSNIEESVLWAVFVEQDCSGHYGGDHLTWRSRAIVSLDPV